MVGFFNTAYAAPAEAASQATHNRLRARLPRTGPIVGWCRNEGETSRLRLWIEVDNSQSGAPVAAMTLLSAGPNRRVVQAWPLQQQALDVALGGPLAVSADAGISYALADIQVPNTVEIVNPELHIATLDNQAALLEMDLVVETGARPLEQCINQVIRFLAGRGLVRLPHGHPARIGLHRREDIMPSCVCEAGPANNDHSEEPHHSDRIP